MHKVIKLSVNQKTLVIFAWCYALGKDFSNPTGKLNEPAFENQFSEAAKSIEKAAFKAIQSVPKANLKKKSQKKMAEAILWLDKIGFVKDGVKRLEVVVALMLALCEELLEYVKDIKRRKNIEELVAAIMKMQEIIDPNFEGTEHYKRADNAYQRFLEI